MIVWLEKPLVFAMHDRVLAEHGGSSGVRDEGLLESALARPQQLFAYGDPPPDLADLAATLAYGIARNHPFVDGNKRTAHASYRTFLELNGATLTATAEDKYLSILGLAEGKLKLEEFSEWLRQRLSVEKGHSVQERAAHYKAKPRRKQKK